MSLIAGAINPLNSDRTAASMEEAARSRLDAIETSKISGEDPAIRDAAEDFEAAFISQMLKFSGLGKALTTGGGEDVAAFTDFYIQNYAEQIVESGGFGLADKFYDKLATRAKEGVSQLTSTGALNVRS